VCDAPSSFRFGYSVAEPGPAEVERLELPVAAHARKPSTSVSIASANFDWMEAVHVHLR
jgi:hypothetical protein